MSTAAHILVVEDEPAIAESVAYALRREGFGTDIAPDLETAQKKLSGAHLLVLDLMLPDGSGFELIDSLDSEQSPAVIVLSSRDDETDRVRALESGADDYVTKPFSPREIVARVRAVLRRSKDSKGEGADEPPQLLSTDRTTRRAHYRDTPLELTRVEFDLLAEMAATPERVFARSELIDRIWGSGFAITDRTIDSHVKSLRRKVAAAGGPPQLIETVRGVGYRVRLKEPLSAEPDVAGGDSRESSSIDGDADDEAT
jgi:two-component system catabolic regulation response regulator CreB